MGRRSILQATAAAALVGCGPRMGAVRTPGSGEGTRFVASAVKRLPGDLALCPVVPRPSQSAVYDDALAVLVLLRDGRHDEAGRILGALARYQAEDGGLPFNVPVEPEPPMPYVRTGAVAWVGYAAVEYLDGLPGGPHREAITTMAHRMAAWLLARQVDREADLRSGLVTGGRGRIRYERISGRVREVFVDGEQTWVATEHNVDAFFFLRALARVSGQAAYARAAERIAGALTRVAWSESDGQLRRGVTESGPDPSCALDGASWGGLMFLATGDRVRAARSLEATRRYESRGARGHRPYADGLIIEGVELRHWLGGPWATARWEDSSLVWPEGSAGVALLTARLGDREGARRLVTALDSLRAKDGAMAGASVEVPFEHERAASIAGTAWVEIVWRELERGPTLWT